MKSGRVYVVQVYRPTLPVRHPRSLQLFEATSGGEATFHCNFRYDFALHNSIKVAWWFYDGVSNQTIDTTSGWGLEIAANDQGPNGRTHLSINCIRVRHIFYSFTD